MSNTELTFRLLFIASGVKNSFNAEYPAEDIQRMTAAVERLKNYPLCFEEVFGIDDAASEHIRTIHGEQNFDLLIADNVSTEDCRKLKALARERNVAVLALVSTHSRKDEILCRGIADTLVTLHRERKVDYDPELGAPVEWIVSKNKHGLCGTCRMYFQPEIMRFQEGGEKFQ